MLMTIIIYLVLLSQLYLLSYYYPNLFIKRIEYILANHSEADYPKLYPTKDGQEKVQKGLRKYKILTRSILILGIVLLTLATIDGMVQRGEIKDSMVTLFAMLQFIPFILTEISELKHYKMMRTENEVSKRSANLSPRRYFDYISPIKFALAAFLLAIYIIFNLYRVDFDLSFGSDGLITLVTIIGVHIYFAATVIWILYGKKLDPHQAHKDRERHIGTVITTTAHVSMAVSAFLLIYGLLQHYSLDQYEALALSIYFQLCIYLGLGKMFKTNKVEDINFEVYKTDLAD